MSLCGRLGPVFPSSAVQTGRYPGTRMSVDPVYKVARSGARVEEMRWRDRTVIDGILGIDVCKNTLDVSISRPPLSLDAPSMTTMPSADSATEGADFPTAPVRATFFVCAHC